MIKTYSEEYQVEVTVTKRQAVAEILRHGLDPNDFFNDEGERKIYTSETLLVWLGY